MSAPAVGDLRVRDVMSRNVRTVDPNEKLVVPDRLATEARIRHFPVVDEDGVLVGIVSQRDIFLSGLLRAIGYGTRGKERLLDSLVVKDVMVTDVVTVAPEALLRTAAKTMLDRKIGCLPVMEVDRLVGIVTESDVVRVVAS